MACTDLCGYKRIPEKGQMQFYKIWFPQEARLYLGRYQCKHQKIPRVVMNTLSRELGRNEVVMAEDK